MAIIWNERTGLLSTIKATKIIRVDSQDSLKIIILPRRKPKERVQGYYKEFTRRGKRGIGMGLG